MPVLFIAKHHRLYDLNLIERKARSEAMSEDLEG